MHTLWTLQQPGKLELRAAHMHLNSASGHVLERPDATVITHAAYQEPVQQGKPMPCIGRHYHALQGVDIAAVLIS